MLIQVTTFALSLLADAAPAGAAPSAQPSFAEQFLPMLLLMGVIFYFMLVRPQQKRAREQAALMTSLKSGDEVVTTGGFHGIVSNARDPEAKTMLIKFAENVKIEVDKSAIVSVIKPGGASGTPADASKALPAAKAV